MRLFACHPALLFSFSCSLIVKVARIMHFFGYFQARSEPYIYSILALQLCISNPRLQLCSNIDIMYSPVYPILSLNLPPTLKNRTCHLLIRSKNKLGGTEGREEISRKRLCFILSHYAVSEDYSGCTGCRQNG